MILYGDPRSAHCYKVTLLAAQLGLSYQWAEVDVMEGEHLHPGYLARNPAGRVPLLELDSGQYLSESNAILNYLATGSVLLPKDSLLQARVLQWQFFEQYSHEPHIAGARYIVKFLGLSDALEAEYQEKLTEGYRALDVMEQQLSKTPFICGERYSIADISLYAYSHCADEGGFQINRYPAIQAWLKRVAMQPRYISMTDQVP